jgi:hypothetical protein
LISYLADAVAMADPQLFKKHAEWMRSSGQPIDELLRKLPRTRLPPEALACLS